MADDKEIEETTAEGDEKPNGKAQTAKKKAEMVEKAKFDELMERNRQNELTIQALQRAGQGNGQQAQRPQAGNTFLKEAAKIIADEMGYDPDLTLHYVTATDKYVNALANQTIYPLFNKLFDELDEVKTRQKFSDYDTYAEDIERERQARSQRNQYLSRQEGYEVIKGRKLPEILAAEQEKLRGESRGDGDDLGGDAGISKAGPGQERGQKTPTSRDYQNMTPAEREAELTRMERSGVTF